MKANDILDMIGDAKGTYVWEAQQVRAQGAAPRKRPTARRMLLAAALIALMLLLVGCAIAYAQSWFVDFFAGRSEAPLSDSQISLIQQNEQIINDAKTHNGWTVELRSAMKDNNKAYIIIGITAPEGVDLEREVVDDTYMDYFSPGNDELASDLDRPPAIILYPKGVVPSSVTMAWEEDGDGKDHTKNYVLKVEPDLTASSVDPFSADAQWKIHIEDIVRIYDDQEYKQELLRTKYKDSYGVMFTPEEIQRMKQREVLVEGIWDFTVSFADQSQKATQLELLPAPIQTVVEIPWQHDEELWQVVDVRKKITVTSILLESLSAKFSYEYIDRAPGEGVPNFWFDDGDLDHNDMIYPYCLMEDGTRIQLQDYGRFEAGAKILEPESPMVLEEVQCVVLPDGTKVAADGTVEPGPKPVCPAGVQAYLEIPSETGVYGYYADFDEDAIEDVAIWYDHAFQEVCLLDEGGLAKKTFHFEDGADVYHTYNQRAAAIKHEPNLIRVVETQDGAETVRYFKVREDGLHLSVGIRQDPQGGESQWFLSDSDPSASYDAAAEVWKPISEETYRRIAEDYQFMLYRLIPIE